MLGVQSVGDTGALPLCGRRCANFCFPRVPDSDPDSDMDTYESEQLARIRDWREDMPSPATRTFSRASGPASKAVRTLLPAAVLRGGHLFCQ